MTATTDCDILAPLNSSAESSGGLTRTYALVVICEIVVIAGLWLLDRFFS